MSFDHWPQWLVLSSLAMRAIVCLIGSIAGQSKVVTPTIVIAVYTIFLTFCLSAGGFFKDLF